MFLYSMKKATDRIGIRNSKWILPFPWNIDDATEKFITMRSVKVALLLYPVLIRSLL